MTEIEGRSFAGERPLYGLRDAWLRGVTVGAGESGIKESGGIRASGCDFGGKYVFWECDGLSVEDSLFREGARSSLWYSRGVDMRKCRVEAPKMFRRVTGVSVRDCEFTDARETLWDCRDALLEDTRIANADYLGMHTDRVTMRRCRLDGNYAFQYTRGAEISGCLLNSKDALWDSSDVTLTDCEINGEYLGWYSRRLRLIRCHITGGQPLCYCDDLYMEDCTLGADAVLALEYCTVHATLRGFVPSIKNPTSGRVSAERAGEVIIDVHQKAPADCVIEVGGKAAGR